MILSDLSALAQDRLRARRRTCSFRPWGLYLAAFLTLSTVLLVFRLGYHREYPISQLLGYSHDHGVGEYSDNANISSNGTAAPSSTNNESKAIIASVVRRDESAADWILDLLPDWEPVIYNVDAPPDQAIKPPGGRVELNALTLNRGREAAVYLSYIINHYYNLPEFMVFLHGARYQTHNDDPMYDTVPEIKYLNLDYVREEGFTSLRCNWKACPASQVEPELGHHDGFWDTKGLYAEAFQQFFPNTTIPSFVSGPCCAQFAVTKDTVRRWPVSKYEQIRQFIWKTESDELNMKMGIVLEYMWHIIFGKPAFFCPSAKECYCKKWNLCDLDCPEEGWCHGRIWLKDSPTHFPPGWPDEGQDGELWPYEGWWEDPEVAKIH